MSDKLGVLVVNQISPAGLSRLPAELYRVGKDVSDPVAILVRSADLHALPIPASVRAIGRAGVGTNNIPVEAMSKRGVPVFNAPGANANAVKELVLAGMLMAARQIAPALRFVGTLDPAAPDLDQAVEDGKKAFSGIELAGQTLGIVGLGKIGCLVADAAIKLGMQCSASTPTSRSMRHGACRRRCDGDERQRGAEAGAVRHPARPARRRDAPPRQRRQHRPGATGRRATQLQPRRRRQRQRGARRARDRPARPVRLRLPRRRAARPGAS
jgi:hypothetical protein